MKQWYVVYTKARQERVAQENLERQNFESYLPLLRQQRHRRGKWLPTIETLFPRYLFVRLDIEVESTATIRSTRGVASLVRFGNDLVSVPDSLVAALQQSADVESGVHSNDKPLFKDNQPVLVIDGPFKDLTGIFQAPSGERRAMILLDMLGRTNLISIDCNNLVATS